MGLLYGINLDNIDWELLIEQKKHLATIIKGSPNEPIYYFEEDQLEALEGIMKLLKRITDKLAAGDYIIERDSKVDEETYDLYLGKYPKDTEIDNPLKLDDE